MTDQSLIPMEEVSLKLFTTKTALRKTLDAIKHEVSGIVFNTDTAKERSECIAYASNVTRSKTAIEKVGKDYAAEIAAEVNAKVKVINGLRKESREFLTDLASNVRSPVTIWEEEQEALAQAEADRLEEGHAYTEAWDMNKLFDREQILAVKEAENQFEARRLEAERQGREQAKEAVRQTEARAAEEIRQANARTENAARVERERLQAIWDEEDRIQEEAEEAARKKAADMNHRRTVNLAILDALVQNGIEEEVAKNVIRLAASGRIPQLKIGY